MIPHISIEAVLSGILRPLVVPIAHLIADMSPTFLANSDQDTMPIAQQANLVTALANLGVTNTSNRQITGYPRLHAFAIWPFVKTDAIAFLDANLK